MSQNDPYQPPSAAAGSAYPAALKASAKEILTTFNGRIPRRVYWLWGIAVGVIGVILLGIIAAIFGSPPDQSGQGGGLGLIGGLLALIVYIPLVWCSLALQIKRWHDRGKSGWWVLINLVPFVGGIWSFVECGCLRGTVGPNQFGEDPT
jgi:uncharacterized membrane protein YhaH (DUF805 family)